MNIWKRLSASLMTGFVVSTASELPKVHPIPVPSLAGTGEFIVLFGPLTPEVSQKLPPHLKAAGRGTTSSSNHNRRVQKESLALIARAIEYIDTEDSRIDRFATADYREG
ncbi:MAG: hypothetical protein JO121_31970 [Deltaproteobacteria bacterium]|nr:hypothetical protein [Deltaproteobacteria bacterium]